MYLTINVKKDIKSDNGLMRRGLFSIGTNLAVQDMPNLFQILVLP